MAVQRSFRLRFGLTKFVKDFCDQKCLPLGDGVSGWRGLTISNPGDILLKKNIDGDANEGFH